MTDVDREPGRSTTAGKDGKLTWRFRAQNVRDVALGRVGALPLGRHQRAVGDADGDGRPDTALIQSFWRPEQRINHWDESAHYGQYSIEFFSKYLWPYPYPHMTAVDGPKSCGGMEYPMMTCIGGQWDTLGMYEVTTHEIGHMWFPMIVGSDEKRFAWMDEGLTQFDQSQSMDAFFKGFDDEARNRKNYLDFAATGGEVELMHHGDRFPNYPAYGVARLLQAGHGPGRAPRRAGPRPVRQGVQGVRPPLAVQAPLTLRLLRHVRGRVRAGPVLVLAHLVLRDLAPGPGDRHRRHRGTTRSRSGSRTGARRRCRCTWWSPGPRDPRTAWPSPWTSGWAGPSGPRSGCAKTPTVKSIEIDPAHEFPDVDRDNQRWPR